MMKCYELQGPDGNEGLKLVDRPVPLPKVGQVLVRIKATSVTEQQDCSMLDWTSAANGALLVMPEAT
jgi:hypothetical protein